MLSVVRCSPQCQAMAHGRNAALLGGAAIDPHLWARQRCITAVGLAALPSRANSAGRKLGNNSIAVHSSACAEVAAAPPLAWTPSCASAHPCARRSLLALPTRCPRGVHAVRTRYWSMHTLKRARAAEYAMFGSAAKRRALCAAAAPAEVTIASLLAPLMRDACHAQQRSLQLCTVRRAQSRQPCALRTPKPKRCQR